MSATRLILAIVWFGIGGYLLANRNESSPWIGFVAIAFAIYNVVRWWFDRPRGLPLPSPMLRRRPHDAPPVLDEYNEAFDFEKAKDDNPGT